MKCKGEKGNVVVEASIVMTIAVVMVAVLIDLGIMLYQRNLMEVVARDAAVDVANVYASVYRDPIYGYMDEKEFYKTDLYRYLADSAASPHNRAAKRKAEWYALYSLKKNELSEIEEPRVRVDVIQKHEALLRHQVVVSIEATFESPLTAIWGGNNRATYTVEGRADCIDLLDYFGTVNMVQDTVLSKIDKFLEPLNKIVGFFDWSSLEG